MIDLNKNSILSKLIFFYRKNLINTKNRFEKIIDHKFENHTRTEIIQLIIERNKFKNYCEIGCNNDDNFKHINSKYLVNKIGVDPVRGGGLNGIRMTSDNFFNQNKIIFDLIFIDGLHTAEQGFKDLINSINNCNINSYIIFHDVLPKSYREQVCPRQQLSWTGDIWKIFFMLDEFKIDYVIGNFDSGVGIIKVDTKLKTTKLDISSFKNLNFEYFYNNFKKLKIKTFHDISNFF